MAYAGADRYMEAITAYEFAYRGGNPTAGQLIHLCELYHATARYRPAVECFREVLRKDPKSFRAQLGLPRALQEFGQLGTR
jgi:tetratricopeptide (TPR) repeat protein